MASWHVPSAAPNVAQRSATEHCPALSQTPFSQTRGKREASPAQPRAPSSPHGSPKRPSGPLAVLPPNPPSPPQPAAPPGSAPPSEPAPIEPPEPPVPPALASHQGSFASQAPYRATHAGPSGMPRAHVRAISQRVRTSLVQGADSITLRKGSTGGLGGTRAAEADDRRPAVVRLRFAEAMRTEEAFVVVIERSAATRLAHGDPNDVEAHFSAVVALWCRRRAEGPFGHVPEQVQLPEKSSTLRLADRGDVVEIHARGTTVAVQAVVHRELGIGGRFVVAPGVRSLLVPTGCCVGPLGVAGKKRAIPNAEGVRLLASDLVLRSRLVAARSRGPGGVGIGIAGGDAEVRVGWVRVRQIFVLPAGFEAVGQCQVDQSLTIIQMHVLARAVVGPPALIPSGPKAAKAADGDLETIQAKRADGRVQVGLVFSQEFATGDERARAAGFSVPTGFGQTEAARRGPALAVGTHRSLRRAGDDLPRAEFRTGADRVELASRFGTGCALSALAAQATARAALEALASD